MYLHQAETPRLLIRKLELTDVSVWEKFYENNPSLPYLGLDLTLNKETQATEWIKLQHKRYKENRYGHHALIDKQTNQFVGQCGLLTQEIEGKLVLEIGYHILPQYWGMGYATEAARKFRDYAFSNNLSKSLVSIIHIDNIASQKVAEKNGMIRGRKIIYYNMEVYIYEISQTDWLNKQQ